MQIVKSAKSLPEKRVSSAEKRDLEAFERWVWERRLAPENRMRFLVGWVERFLRLQAIRPREHWQDTLRVFLEDLGAGQTKSWQLRQAADAVTLYCGQFREADDTSVLPMQPTGVEQADPSQILAEMRRLLELRHYSPRTNRTYLGWTRRFLQYTNTADGALGPENVKTYLSYLATRRNVAASTQNQAFNALLFLYRNVLQIELGDMGNTVRAKRGRKLPVVLSPEETKVILAEVQGSPRLMLELIYGGGLRVGELATLRVKDIDFDAATLTVRAGKGDMDRMTFLPKRLIDEIRKHLAKVKNVHGRDLASGAGEAPLPTAWRGSIPTPAASGRGNSCFRRKNSTATRTG